MILMLPHVVRYRSGGNHPSGMVIALLAQLTDCAEMLKDVRKGVFFLCLSLKQLRVRFGTMTLRLQTLLRLLS